MLPNKEKIWKVLTKRREFRIPSMHDLVHKGEHFAHMAYLGLVSVESHYWYGKAAMVMLVLTIMSIFIHEGEE